MNYDLKWRKYLAYNIHKYMKYAESVPNILSVVVPVNSLTDSYMNYDLEWKEYLDISLFI